MSHTQDDELAALASDSVLDLDAIGEEAELHNLAGSGHPEPTGELGELTGSEEELEALRPLVPKLSLLRHHKSSLIGHKRKRVRIRDLAYYAGLYADDVADGLLKAVGEAEKAPGLLDCMPDAEQLVTVKTLAKLRQDGCKDLASVIITRPVVEDEDDTQLIIDHLKAMELDSIAIICTATTERTQVNKLRRRGYRQGLDYEFLDSCNLLPYEKQVLRRVLNNGSEGSVKLIRKLREK